MRWGNSPYLAQHRPERAPVSGYTKLFGSILDSTVWELPMPTKVTWIAMLAMADRNGEVQASIPGLAKRAGVSLEQCEEALKAFMSPDRYSRTKEHDGRRIEEMDGGWRLLNHGKYRQQLSAELQRERDTERKRRLRAGQKRDKAGHFGTVPASPDIAEAEAAPEAEAKAVNGSDSLLAAFGSSKPTVYRFLCNGPIAVFNLTQEQLDAWEPLYPGVDIIAECGKALAWLEANGRKTARGMPKFLVGWLNRANDKPRMRSPPIDRYQQTLAAGQRFLERHEGDD
jgi:hypothetical protein